MEIAVFRYLSRIRLRFVGLDHNPDDRPIVRVSGLERIGADHRHVDNVIVRSVQMVLHDLVPRAFCESPNDTGENTRTRVGRVRQFGRPVHRKLFKENQTRDWLVHV